MTNINAILEEFKTSFRLKDPSYSPEPIYVEIFENPTVKEIASFKDGFRWLADNRKKKFYIFNKEVLHNKIYKHIGYSEAVSKHIHGNLHFYEPNFLAGVYSRKEGEVSVDSLWIAPANVSTEMLKKDWKWAYKYLPELKNWLDRNRKNIKELKKRFERENLVKKPKKIKIASDFLREF